MDMYRKFLIMHRLTSDILTDGTVFTKQNLLGNDDYLFHESTTIPSGAMYMTYNAAMIDSLGLEAPESLAEKGEWTWDKLQNMQKHVHRIRTATATWMYTDTAVHGL